MYQVAKFSRLLAKRYVVPAYQGAGDIVSGAKSWWGLRAYTLAGIGANAVRLRESGANGEQNFATIAGGGLDIAAITTFKGANNLFLVTFYDQTGNGNNLTQSNSSLQLPFILSGLGSFPVLRYSIDGQTATMSGFTQAQPFTNSWVGKRTGVFTTFARVFSDGSGVPASGFANTTNTAFSYAGTVISGTAADNSFHAVQAVYNGASSDCNINGSATTGNAGSSAHSAAVVSLNADSVLRADLVEVGIWPAAFSSGQSSAMSSNQHNYWGF